MTRFAAAGRALAKPAAETVLGGLILLYTALTVIETTSTDAPPLLGYVSHALAVLFTAELGVRYLAAPSRRGFVREYWLDAVSVVPFAVATPFVFVGLASARTSTTFGILALLRIVRLFRVLKIARHRVLLFPRVLKRGARELFFASGIVLLAVVLASSALVTFERDHNPALRTFSQALWFCLYSVVAAEPIPGPPVTVAGHVAALCVILTGVFTFATVVGTISALVTDRMRSGDIVMDWEDLKDHLIVCGYSRKAQIIIREYIAAHPDDPRPVVVVAEFETLPNLADPASRGRVQFLNDDFTKIEALEKAGVRRAARCVLVADTSRGRKERDADARTVLAALTIERLNPSIYTCAEIHRREHAHHLEMGGVNDYVVGGEQSAFLLAQSIITRGVMSVFSELMSQHKGNRLVRCSVPRSWKGKPFLDLLVHLKEKHDALLVAVHDGKKIVLNPKAHVFAGGEDVVVIACGEFAI